VGIVIWLFYMCVFSFVGLQYGDSTVAVDGWSVTSGTARTGLGGVVKVFR